MKRGQPLACDPHGRLPWLGHVQCDDCGTSLRRAPTDGRCPSCHSCRLSEMCAKCFASDGSASEGVGAGYDRIDAATGSFFE